MISVYSTRSDHGQSFFFRLSKREDGCSQLLLKFRLGHISIGIFGDEISDQPSDRNSALIVRIFQISQEGPKPVLD